jgi:peptidyl-prolyl cis-trans isomerase SurA
MTDMMLTRFKQACLWLCVGAVALGAGMDTAWAQKGKRDKDAAPKVTPRIPGARHLSTDLKLEGVETTADYIMAVVNSELVTFTDVDKRVARVFDSAPPGSNLPPVEQLRQQVLDALIDEKIQLQYARSLGMSVSDEEVDEAVANIAAQNQITLTELRSRMKADGLDYDRYRNSLREQMMLERIRAREVNRRIEVSDDDIEAFEAETAASGRNVDLHLAHILVAVPENAPADVVAKLAEKATFVRQRARHILIRTSAQMSEKAALDRMNDIRKQIVSGQASFAQMARQHSQDGSATKGGDLGFASPGQFVPEFERALTALQTGEMSQPVVSRFGVHLIQLMERREVSLSDQQKRDAVRAVLREQRFESAYEDWARELRAAAFVDMRNAP